MKKLILILLSIVALYAKSSVDCIILEDENSIVCKYTHTRIAHDHNITVNWIEPVGFISRTRTLKIPAYHGSVYDYRYIKGRTKGLWTFEVVDDGKSYRTHFELK